MNSLTPPSSRDVTVRLLISDDHAVVRKGIRALLMTEGNIEVVGEAKNGYQAVAEAGRLRPDVILMDIVMPEMDGIEAIRRITARQPEARILVLTSFASDDKVFPAIKAGALGYLLKDSGPEELVQAIHQVYRREPSLHPAIAQKVLNELSQPAEHGPAPEPLGGREAELLGLVARGRSNRQIAEQLAVDEVEVCNCISAILGKLHLASRTQAVLYALKEGLASLDDAAPNYVSKLLATLGKPTAVEVATTDSALSSEQELEKLRMIAADHRQVGQELALAGEIQASFLPDSLPQIKGWQLAAALEPARETSGDFYDVIPLPNGRLAFLIADVAGKGMGAALYMALSRTLMRTYALQYDTQPEQVLAAVNRRILSDTKANLFVTLFYGILNPENGKLAYSNAGHNPPYLLRGQNKDPALGLIRTGMPLGIFENVAWERETVQLKPGDMVVLYTDGVTEAQDKDEVFFATQRLLEVTQAHLARSAQAVQEALIEAVHNFVGNAPNAWRDDLTVMVVARDP